MWRAFIRPTRQEYSIQDLGNPLQKFGQHRSQRSDFTLKNKNKQTLQCSFYQNLNPNQNENKQKSDVIVYCHCNSGSKLEALYILPQVIMNGLSLFSFDFSGSGLSDGEYVTLGQNESSDLECIIEHLRQQPYVNNICLWGRSMGAVTSLLYLSKNKEYQKYIKAVVFDSGFANLSMLALDLAKQKTKMPEIFTKTVLIFVQNQIKEKCDLDIKSIDLTKFVENIEVPCFFLCSQEDTFVNCKHSETIHNLYKGLKYLQYIKGDHNDVRSKEINNNIIEWILSIFSNHKRSYSFLSGNQLPSSFKNNQIPVTQSINLSNNNQQQKEIQTSNILQQNQLNKGSLGNLHQSANIFQYENNQNKVNVIQISKQIHVNTDKQTLNNQNFYQYSLQNNFNNKNSVNICSNTGYIQYKNINTDQDEEDMLQAQKHKFSEGSNVIINKHINNNEDNKKKFSLEMGQVHISALTNEQQDLLKKYINKSKKT